MAKGCTIFIAADGKIKALLQNEFPQASFLLLKGYHIQYSKQKKWLPLKMLAQLPGIVSSIYREQQWLKTTVKIHDIDAVIADNRFGLYHATVPSVYLTHQLIIKTGNSFSEKIVAKINYWFIQKYAECWVPDFEGNINIAGELSHPQFLPSNLQYIGCLSRFKKAVTTTKKYDLLVLLSGPEPQRTLFEEILVMQLRQFSGTVLLVRGLPGDISAISAFNNGNIKFINHLGSAELNQAIAQSEIIICRSGYTTVMDLIKLQKKAVLVPTPGQTEQEYLAAHLLNQQFFYSVNQPDFNLQDALKKAAVFEYRFAQFNMDQYQQVVNQFLKRLSNLVKMD